MIFRDFEQNRKSKTFFFFFFGFDFLILVKSEQNRKSETFFFFGFDFSELLQNLAYIQYIHYFRFRVYTLSQKRK